MEYIMPGRSPNGLWVTFLCQCKFVLCNKLATLVEDVGNEGAMLLGGLGMYEKSLYLQLSFIVNLKTAKNETSKY